MTLTATTITFIIITHLVCVFFGAALFKMLKQRGIPYLDLEQGRWDRVKPRIEKADTAGKVMIKRFNLFGARKESVDHPLIIEHPHTSKIIAMITPKNTIAKLIDVRFRDSTFENESLRIELANMKVAMNMEVNKTQYDIEDNADRVIRRADKIINSAVARGKGGKGTGGGEGNDSIN